MNNKMIDGWMDGQMIEQ